MRQLEEPDLARVALQCKREIGWKCLSDLGAGQSGSCTRGSQRQRALQVVRRTAGNNTGTLDNATQSRQFVLRRQTYANTHLGGLAQPRARLHGGQPRVACRHSITERPAPVQLNVGHTMHGVANVRLACREQLVAHHARLLGPQSMHTVMYQVHAPMAAPELALMQAVAHTAHEHGCVSSTHLWQPQMWRPLKLHCRGTAPFRCAGSSGWSPASSCKMGCRVGVARQLTGAQDGPANCRRTSKPRQPCTIPGKAGNLPLIRVLDLLSHLSVQPNAHTREVKM